MLFLNYFISWQLMALSFGFQVSFFLHIRPLMGNIKQIKFFTQSLCIFIKQQLPAILHIIQECVAFKSCQQGNVIPSSREKNCHLVCFQLLVLGHLEAGHKLYHNAFIRTKVNTGQTLFSPWRSGRESNFVVLVSFFLHLCKLFGNSYKS